MNSMGSVLGVAASLVPGTLAGIYITLNLSALNRLVINTGRPIIVWIVSLALQWQDFKILQLIGFLIMIIGVFTFGDVLHFGMQRRSELEVYTVTTLLDYFKMLFSNFRIRKSKDNGRL